MMQDVSTIATGLVQDADGIWRARTASTVDYPDEGNAFCFAVEDGSFWFQHRNAVITDVVRRYPAPGFIADLGAGNGYVSLGLARAGFETLVLEPGDAGIRNARTRGLSPLVCATLQDAGFLPASLPGAGMFDVLEHIEDDLGVLRLLHQLLVPGGRLYFTVPSFQWLWSSEDDLAGHHRRYTTETLSARLREAGFTPEYATYLFAPLPLPIFFLRSIPSWFGLRKTLEAGRAAEELQPKEGMMVRLIRRALAREQQRIAAGGSIPFGSSLLLVARK